MLQAFVKKGIVIADNVPAPKVGKGSLLIKVAYSCISTGTELYSVAESGKSLISRVVSQPEKISKGLKMMFEKGLKGFLGELKSVTEGITQVGYSLAGTIEEVGEGVTEFSVGEKVAAAGGGYANHAEYVNVPKNLVIKIDQNLDLKYASTVALGGIALQGIRRSGLSLGEYALVFGCGAIGLITIQLLKKSGVRVIALDIDDSRMKLAKEFGAERIFNAFKDNYESEINSYTGGYGVDAVIFTASTDSSEPLSKSFKVCRKKGKVILVGVSGLNINRDDIYSKELDFLISTSYGPGRYDSKYEEDGIDYPYPYVRWTENRNMAEYLKLVNSADIKLDKIINKVFKIDNVENAYEYLSKTEPKPLLALLEYPQNNNPERQVIVSVSPGKKEKINVAVVGAGSFAQNVLIPNLQRLKDKFELISLMDSSGAKAKEIANRIGFKKAVTDYDHLISDPDIDLLIITTRHDSHFKYAYDGLISGKHVFVEKPLCTKLEELELFKKLYSENSRIQNQLLFVGYNRRFSPYLKEIKKHTDNRINPLLINYRMNAGYVPLDNWVHNDGGRIVGEACHIVDIFNYLTGSYVLSIFAENITPLNDKISSSDNKVIIIKYKDGSVCVLHYFSVGSTLLSKEYMEVHFDGKSILMDNYKSLKSYNLNINPITTKISEKGHFEELTEVAKFLLKQTNKIPIEIQDIFQTSEITLNI